MKKILLTVLVLCISHVSMGAPMRLGLEEAIGLAYENSYILKNADIDQINSGLQVREAYKEALPKIDYIGRADKSADDIYDDNRTRYDHRIELVQPVYRGGAIDAGISAARSIDERSSYEYLKIKSDLRLVVIEQYITILQLNENRRVYENSLREVEDQYKRVKRKYDLNLVAKSEVLPFKTRVINTRTNLIEIGNRTRIAEIELKNQLGVERGREIELAPLENRRYDTGLIDIEADVRSARINNREAKIARLDVEVVKAHEKAARSEFLPKADLRFGYGSSDRRFDDSADDWQWNAGLTVSMNLFSFGQDRDAYERAKNNTEKSLNREKRAQDDIEVDVRSFYLDLMRLEGTLAEQGAAVESARENLLLEKRRYDRGLTTVIDFLQIENSFREAKLSLIEAELNFYLAYERYMDSLR